MRGVERGRCGLSLAVCSCCHKAQKNYGDLTPYFTYEYTIMMVKRLSLLKNYSQTFSCGSRDSPYLLHIFSEYELQSGLYQIVLGLVREM